MIIPTIQTSSLDEIQQKIALLAELKQRGADIPTHLQIDIVDGVFADDLTVMPSDLGSLKWQGFTFETHLLTIDPDEYVGEADSVGATAIIAQIERLEHTVDFLKVVKQLKHQAGLGLDIFTPVSELTAAELELADLILLMAVPVGHSGQPLKSHIYNQIRDLRARGFAKPIEIDGGINPLNIAFLKQAGADMFAVNSALWVDNDIVANVIALQKSLKEPPAHDHHA